MFGPLNPWLYDRLQHCFGRVRIENAGCSGWGAVVLDPVSLRPRRRASGSEEYVVRCPFCVDHSGHLYINYRYGLDDTETEQDNLQLAHCFREECLKDPDNRRFLAERIFTVRPASPRQGTWPAPFHRPAEAPGRSGHRRPTADDLQLAPLAPNTVPSLYLHARGFDVAELAATWGIRYCTGSGRYRLMSGRIYVPVTMDDALVGWQGRYPAELDWAAAGAPKYYNAPGMTKSQVLYNYDLARAEPVVVVVEGVTDVWRVGPAGVALFGKSASEAQVRLLAATWSDRPVLILLDAEAQAEARELRRRLVALHPRDVAVLSLPSGLDPASCPRALLGQYIVLTAQAQSVRLPEAAVSLLQGPAAGGPG